MTSRKIRVITACFGIAIGLLGIANVLLQKHEARKRERMLAMLAQDFRERDQKRDCAGVVIWESRRFCPGDRIRIAKWAGTFKPEETGASSEVQANAGRTGVILRGEKRERDVDIGIDPKNEPIQIVRVRWDKQRWNVLGDQTLELAQFEATIHISYLEVLPSAP